MIKYAPFTNLPIYGPKPDLRKARLDALDYKKFDLAYLYKADKRIIPSILKLVATDIEGAFLEEACYSEKYNNHVIREYKSAILGMTNWLENRRNFYKNIIHIALLVADVYSKRKIMNVLMLPMKEEVITHSFLSTCPEMVA